MMKKLTGILTATIAAAALFLGANTVANADTTITVGASSAPHAEILRHIQPKLKKEGINLKIKVFDDYIMPNKALANGEIDANYFQHIPFLKEYKSLKKLPKNAKVYVSSNVSDYGRVLKLFKDAGLITLKKGTKLKTATFNDIKTNKRNITFKHTFEAKLMPKLYESNEADATVINSNYAVQAGLKPTKDAIALEKKSSPYANLIAVQKGDQKKPAIKKLVKALKSKSTQKWINNKYNGAVLPVGNQK